MAKTVKNFEDEYDIVKEIASGSDAKVILVKNKTNKYYSAVKIYNGNKTNNFDNEINIINYINTLNNTLNNTDKCNEINDNIVEYYDYFTTIIKNKRCYCVSMEFIDGITLNEYIFNNDIEDEEIINITVMFLEKIKFLVSIGINHNDLHLGNIIRYKSTNDNGNIDNDENDNKNDNDYNNNVNKNEYKYKIFDFGRSSLTKERNDYDLNFNNYSLILNELLILIENRENNKLQKLEQEIIVLIDEYNELTEDSTKINKKITSVLNKKIVPVAHFIRILTED